MNGNSTSLRPQSDFYIPKTHNGMDATQAPFELKVSLIHLLHLKNSKWNEWKLNFPSTSK